MRRRGFIKAGTLTAVASVTHGCTDASALSQTTPGEAEGPFYPIIAQKDKDFDLTKVDSSDKQAWGALFIDNSFISRCHSRMHAYG
ncbi:MAG: hypothetical protein COC05_01680 [Gammaproteobacteria bacterium]|nr:MAG: hypothetical protein COC05_01680 [Gammaproteobacteria bacterium]